MAAPLVNLTPQALRGKVPTARLDTSALVTPTPPWAWLAGHDAWKKQHYHSIMVRFPDGSSCYIPAEPLIWFAASRLARFGVAIERHVTEQMVPAAECAPELLVDLARELTWAQVRQLAQQALWGSAIALNGAAQWQQAALTLSTYRFK